MLEKNFLSKTTTVFVFLIFNVIRDIHRFSDIFFLYICWGILTKVMEFPKAKEERPSKTMFGSFLAPIYLKRRCHDTKKDISSHCALGIESECQFSRESTKEKTHSANEQNRENTRREGWSMETISVSLSHSLEFHTRRKIYWRLTEIYVFLFFSIQISLIQKFLTGNGLAFRRLLWSKCFAHFSLVWIIFRDQRQTDTVQLERRLISLRANHDNNICLRIFCWSIFAWFRNYWICRDINLLNQKKISNIDAPWFLIFRPKTYLYLNFCNKDHCIDLEMKSWKIWING